MPEAIHFRCPTCEGRLKAKAEAVGKIIDCPKCRNRVRIPETDELCQERDSDNATGGRKGQLAGGAKAPSQTTAGWRRWGTAIGVVLVLLASGWGIYYYLSARAAEDAVCREVLASLNEMNDVLDTVADERSAKTAEPAVRKARERILDGAKKWEALPAGRRHALVKEYRPEFSRSLDRYFTHVEASLHGKFGSVSFAILIPMHWENDDFGIDSEPGAAKK